MEVVLYHKMLNPPVLKVVLDSIHKELSSEQSHAMGGTFNLHALDADSLDLMEIILALEDAYHISIPDNSLRLSMTLDELTLYIEQRLRIN